MGYIEERLERMARSATYCTPLKMPPEALDAAYAAVLTKDVFASARVADTFPDMREAHETMISRLLNGALAPFREAAIRSAQHDAAMAVRRRYRPFAAYRRGKR